MKDTVDLKILENALLDRQQELLGIAEISRESSAVVALDQSRVGRLSRMDAMQAQALSVAADGRRQQELSRVTRALELIDEGEYGFCERCGEEIPVARLRIDPAAEYCVQCADKVEQGN